MNVKELKKLLKNAPDNALVLLCQEGINKHVYADLDKFVPDPTQDGYSRKRALYRVAESDDNEDDMIDVFCIMADD